MTTDTLPQPANQAVRRQRKASELGSSFVPMTKSHRMGVIGFYVLYVFTVTIAAIMNGTKGGFYVLPALAVCCVVQLWPVMSYKTAYGWFHPLVFGSVYGLIRLLRNFGTYAFGLESHLALPEYGGGELAQIIAYSLAVITGGQISYYAGFFLGPRIATPPLVFQRPVALEVRMMMLIALSAVGIAFFLAEQGGVTEHFAFLAGGRAQMMTDSDFFFGPYLILVHFALAPCLLWLACGRRPLMSPIFWLSTAGVSVLSYLVAGSRSAVFYAMISVLCVLMIRRKKILLGTAVVAGILTVAFLGWGMQMRQSSWKGAVEFGLADGQPIAELLGMGIEELSQRSGEGDPLYAILARVPKEVDLLSGKSYLTLLTFPIPRVWWPDKPRSTGVLIGPTFFDHPSPKPPGPVGEAYWNFHVAGVVGVFFLFGVFHQWLARFYARYASSAALAPFLVLTLIYLSPEVLSFVNWAQRIVALGVTMIVGGILSFSRRRTV